MCNCKEETAEFTSLKGYRNIRVRVLMCKISKITFSSLVSRVTHDTNPFMTHTRLYLNGLPVYDPNPIKINPNPVKMLRVRVVLSCRKLPPLVKLDSIRILKFSQLNLELLITRICHE